MAPSIRMQFLVAEEIGPNRALNSAGFLLCTDVPLARTGKMDYAPGETPVAVGPKGYVEIERNADEVFNPQSLASYSGVPFTLEHPADDVIPTNWRDLAHGDVLNARRGSNELSECVVGDILVKSPEAIAAVQSGKREVSVGYTCDYDEIEPGRGRQRNIVVNHVALVERGRCGPRCSIGDEAPTEIENMTAKNAKTADSGLLKRAFDKVRTAIKAKDAEATEKGLNELETVTDLVAEGDPAGGLAAPSAPAVHIHLGDEEKGEKKDEKTQDARDKAVDARFSDLEAKIDKVADAFEEFKKGEKKDTDDEKILGALQFEAPPGTSDAAIKDSTKDSAILSHAFQETVSLAEVLAPGITAPTFDVKLPAAKTFDSICRHRRAALQLASNNPKLHQFIVDGLPRGKTFDTMTCDEARSLFKGAAAVARGLNNGGGAKVNIGDLAAAKNKSGVTTIADLNKLGKEKYGAHH